MRELDSRAIREFGIPGIVLMENAGLRAADEIFETLCPEPDPEKKQKPVSPASKHVLVLAGGGNNGGDGFVIARHLINRGMKVTVYLVAEESKIKGDALTNFNILRKMKAEILPVPPDVDLVRKFRGFDIVVDAIFGTGLNSEIRGHAKDVIGALNAAHVTVVSVDVPSGMDSDTGDRLGVVVRATKTVTFGLPKKGLHLNSGVSVAGEVVVVDISIPKKILEV